MSVRQVVFMRAHKTSSDSSRFEVRHRYRQSEFAGALPMPFQCIAQPAECFPFVCAPFPAIQESELDEVVIQERRPVREPHDGFTLDNSRNHEAAGFQ
jgi:hypothetical protein